MPIAILARYYIAILLEAYLVVLLARAVISWLPVVLPRLRLHGVFAMIMHGIVAITEPPLRILRRYIPPLRLGNITLDVSFMVLYIIPIVVLRLLWLW